MQDKSKQEADQFKVPSTKAVAIDGERTSGGAPKIVAKGKGFNAERILDIAFAEGVKVRQDRELTDILDQFEVESPVPLEALHAVSLILDRVYQENRRLAGEPVDDALPDAPTPAQDKGQS